MEVCLESRNLAKAKHALLSMYDLLLASPGVASKERQEKIKKTLAYCQKTLKVYEEIDEHSYDEEGLLSRVLSKIRTLYFF